MSFLGLLYILLSDLNVNLNFLLFSVNHSFLSNFRQTCPQIISRRNLYSLTKVAPLDSPHSQRGVLLSPTKIRLGIFEKSGFN